MFKNQTDITAALQDRIDELATIGGGEIVIPSGEFHFRTIELKSNICLHLKAGSRLVASPNRADYKPIGYEHNEMGEVYSAIFAKDQVNITLKGDGEIHLSGSSFYHMDKPSKVETAGPEITQKHLDEAPRTYDWRVNQPIFFHRCANIRVDGLRISDAPCWTVTTNFCENLKVTNLTIKNSLVLPNSDGIHCCGTRDILISGCHITAGDDCVALSSITDWSVPCENAVITNCIFQSASKAISIGYMHSIVRNVLIENVIVKKSNRAFVSMCNPRTGLVENIRVTNCLFEGRSYGGNWWGNGEAIVLMVTPHHYSHYRDPMPEPRFEKSIRNISFTGITCISQRPIGVVASEPLIENVRFKDCTIEFTEEQQPSLKGSVIDLAPGPVNYEISKPNIGIVYKNAELNIEQVTTSDRTPVLIEEIRP